MRHKDTVELYQYWNDVRDGRPAPERSDISPAALGRLLPSIMLLECDNAGDMNIRLAGSRLCTLHGSELRGRRFADLWTSDSRRTVIRATDSVIVDNVISVLDVHARSADGRCAALEIALMPLVGGSSRIIGIASAMSTPVWLGSKPASLDLISIRFINSQSEFAFLQNRPAIPLRDRRITDTLPLVPQLSSLAKLGRAAGKSVGRNWRILDGGKK